MRINLCCGPNLLPGWVNVDIQGADVNVDLEHELLPFPDASASVVVCISAINYFTRERGRELLADVLRVLRPGGLLRLGVQDLQLLARRYLDGDMAFWGEALKSGADRFAGPTLADKFNGFFYGFQSYGKSCRWVYDAQSLTLLLTEAGFSSIAPKAYRESEIPEIERIDNRPEQMFFLEARRGADTADSLMDDAEALFAKGREEQGWQRVLAALDKDPGHGRALDKAVAVCLARQLPGQARKALAASGRADLARLSMVVDKVEKLLARTKPQVRAEPPAQESWLGAPQADRVHLDAAMAWLARARAASLDRGVPALYDLAGRRYEVSYPETTGYIISTYLTYARLTDDDAWREAAMAMGDWEADIQFPQGGAGEPLGVAHPVRPRVFNTGQVVLGWVALWRETGQTRYLEAAVRAGDFLLANLDPDGAWRRHVYQGPRAYKSRVSWALLELFAATDEERFREGAERSLSWIMRRAHADGWFSATSLTAPDRPWTHLIGYVLVGLGECQRFAGLALDEKALATTLLRAGRRLCRHVEAMARDGRLVRLRGLPGTFGPGWTTDDAWNCVTGTAQIALFLRRQARLGLGEAGEGAAHALIEACKTAQFCQTDDPDIRGGLPGSIPFAGQYCGFMIPNWGVKFFADCLLDRLDVVSQTDCLG